MEKVGSKTSRSIIKKLCAVQVQVLGYFAGVRNTLKTYKNLPYLLSKF